MNLSSFMQLEIMSSENEKCTHTSNWLESCRFITHTVRKKRSLSTRFFHLFSSKIIDIGFYCVRCQQITAIFFTGLLEIHRESNNGTRSMRTMKNNFQFETVWRLHAVLFADWCGARVRDRNYFWCFGDAALIHSTVACEVATALYLRQTTEQ